MADSSSRVPVSAHSVLEQHAAVGRGASRFAGLPVAWLLYRLGVHAPQPQRSPQRLPRARVTREADGLPVLCKEYIPLLLGQAPENTPRVKRVLVGFSRLGTHSAIVTRRRAAIPAATPARRRSARPAGWVAWLAVGVAIFWVLEMAIIVRGMDTLRRFENWAAPFVLVVAVALLIFMAAKAHGFGSILSQPSHLGWGSRFWPVFFPSLMAMIAFWSTLSLNMPDFTRFGRSQRQQAIGQVLGLPTTMTFFALLAVFITAASQKVCGASSLSGSSSD
jgi:permease for cytosine/purines